ncbi:MAG TPA: tetratricopeptide repeat protein [bacterium]|nr:tetratricopeptide repeat protein [bacterium]
MKKFLLILPLLLAPAFARAQDATVSALQDAVKANPNSYDAHFNLGVAFFNGRQYDLAAPEFKRAMDLKGGDSQAREMYESSLGIAAYLKQDFSNAIPHLKAVLAVNPKNPNANLLLGNA